MFIRFVVSCGFSLTPSILSSSRLFGKRFYSISFRAFSVFTPMSFLTSWSLLRAGTIDSEVMISLRSWSIRLLLSSRTLSAKPSKYLAASLNARVCPGERVTSLSSKLPFLTPLKIPGAFSLYDWHSSSNTSTAFGFCCRMRMPACEAEDRLIPDLLFASAAAFAGAGVGASSSSSNLTPGLIFAKIVSSLLVSCYLSSKRLPAIVSFLLFVRADGSYSAMSASRPTSSARSCSSYRRFSRSVTSKAFCLLSCFRLFLWRFARIFFSCRLFFSLAVVLVELAEPDLPDLRDSPLDLRLLKLLLAVPFASVAVSELDESLLSEAYCRPAPGCPRCPGWSPGTPLR